MIRAKSTRRDFIKKAALASAGISVYPGNVFALQSPSNSNPFISLVKNGSPEQMIAKALQPLGGMSAFVKKGQVVVVKPNMSWDRRPEQGANTNPEVMAAVVKLVLNAGAKEVRVFDRTCNERRRCYAHSGVSEAAEKAGAKVHFVNERNFKLVKIPNGRQITDWEVYEDLLNADVVINLPTLKHHSLTLVSIGLKNLMGFMGGDRGKIHRNFDQKIVDFATIVKPDLTIVDATRVLLRNGPQGGNLDDVEHKNTILASTDMIAIDAFAASLMGIESQRLGYLVEAEQRGMGVIDMSKMKIEQLDLGYF